jgi:ASC-1-like (ASCH) protein
MAQGRKRASHVGGFKCSPFLCKPEFIRDIISLLKTLECRLLVNPKHTDNPVRTARANRKARSVLPGDTIMVQFYGYWAVCSVTCVREHTTLAEVFDLYSWRQAMPRCDSLEECIAFYLQLYPNAHNNTSVISFQLSLLEYKLPREDQILLCSNCKSPNVVSRYDAFRPVPACTHCRYYE